MGTEFTRFMSKAIIQSWTGLGGIEAVQPYLAEFTQLVYGREASPDLATRFAAASLDQQFYSGEFDALSYAFYRSAFEAIHQTHPGDKEAIASEQRAFTRQVGAAFFNQAHDHLVLELPQYLVSPAQFAQLQEQLQILSSFLLNQGYLRDQCDFSFEVQSCHGDFKIQQTSNEFLGKRTCLL